MHGYFAIATIISLILIIVSRIIVLNKMGIKPVIFGGRNKKDYCIIPFVLFYIYIVISSALNIQRPGKQVLSIDIIGWIGVVLCIIGLVLLLLSLVSFGKSFRIGIDEEYYGFLVTRGVFAVSRNPIYTAFGFILLGIFLIYLNWILFFYFTAGIWYFNRQVQREEEALKRLYGEKYNEYCERVPRYF